MENDGWKSIVVSIDPDLRDIVPAYLKNKRLDVEIIRTLLKEEDFETLRDLAHNIKGSGGGYGFDRITELGGALEQAAEAEDISALDILTETLADYLDKLSIVCGCLHQPQKNQGMEMN
ncbi:MAG: Hpt domain-containing protein [Deltaproteobacteria bacterium]|nr:Hpt domain-containing protein [Deltaproteobacteria bacterium]